MDSKELIEEYVSGFLEQLENQRAVEEATPRERSPRPALSLNQFYELTGKLIQTQQQLEGQEKKVLYSSEMPDNDDNIEEERIVYCLIERKPGMIEQGISAATQSDNVRRQRLKMFREAKVDPDHPGMTLYTYGQWFDNIVEFKIYARTNNVANSRAIWFEDLIDLWSWYLKASGAKELIYLGRGQDKSLAPENRKLVCRPLRYLVRTEKVTVIRENMLRSLVVQSSVQ